MFDKLHEFVKCGLCTTRKKLQNDNMAMILIYIGPCTMMGAQWCHSFVSLHTGTVGQSIVLLLVSFAYRLWIL
ncbi:hypothetical protein PFISCL1PPCAC_13425, partial [Pristionchus fissidentatus]